jgi:hypothetical protein
MITGAFPVESERIYHPPVVENKDEFWEPDGLSLAGVTAANYWLVFQRRLINISMTNALQ